MENVYISQEQLNNAKMYSNRWSWLKTLPTGLNILEVGTAAGDYSNRILERSPEKLFLLDLFDDADVNLDHVDNPRFGKGQAFDFIKNRFNLDNVFILQGNSHDILPKMRDDLANSLDIVYIDADHDYHSVLADIKDSIPLLKSSGMLVINDYLINDSSGAKYGVVPAVNHFLMTNPEWEVVGFALDRQMFCDIHLRLRSS